MSRVQERGNTFEERRENQEGRYEERKAARLAQVLEKREKADEVRASGYTRLEALAQTPEQEAAFATFKTTVEEAVSQRRSTIDAAIETFESTVQSLWEDREDAAAAYASDFETDMNELFETARTQCDDDEDPGTVRTQLREGINALRTQYQTRAQEMTYRAEYTAAREALQQATRTAWDEFRLAVGAAKADLRTAFGVAGGEGPETDETDE